MLIHVSPLAYLCGQVESLIYTQVICSTMEEPTNKVIKVTLATREKLKQLGNKGDTYEDIITRMFSRLEANTEAQKQ